MPLALLLPLCLILAVLVAAGVRWVGIATIPADRRDGAYAIAGPLMSPLGAGFAILAALTLANEVSHITSAETIVSSEAGNAARLAWAATTPGGGGAPVRGALERYLLAARAHEWHGHAATTGNDPATGATLAALERRVRAQATAPRVQTAVRTELLTAMDALTADRRARLAASAKELPTLYLLTVLVSAIALIANGSVLTIRAGPRALLLTGGLTIVIGLSVALILALSSPVGGPIAVSFRPLEQVLHDLGSGYFGV